jgi:hypothetical protein
VFQSVDLALDLHKNSTRRFGGSVSFKKDVTMHTEDSLFLITPDHQEGAATEMDWETIHFDRLVYLVDDAGLIRLGLKLMERVAQAEGRVLWH